MLLFAKNYSLRISLSLIFLVLLFSSTNNAQIGDNPSTQSLINEAQIKQKEFSSRLRDYTYILKRSMQELNDKGEIKKERIKVYQVFPLANGMPVMMLLSENGKDLSSVQLAKEKVRANKEWRKRKKGSENNESLSELLKTPFFLEGSEFTTVRSERYNNRDVIVLKFKSRQDFKPANDSEKFRSRLEGELWVDVIEKAIVKLDGKLTESYKPGLLGHISPLQPGTSLLIESSPIANNTWAITRIEFVPGQITSLFSKTVQYRYKQKEEMSDYKPFNKDAVDLFAN